jgi:hypothetical protein
MLIDKRLQKVYIKERRHKMAFFDFLRKLFKGKKKPNPILTHEKGKLDVYKGISQIDVRKGTDVINFSKISINEIQQYNYKEITSDRIKGGLSNIVSTGTQIAALSALNPTGLFTATVLPQLLTLFADGTVSTMIHQGGHIAAHAGFQSISATVFAPIAIMQLLSMVTGQYYMNGITKQLKNIDKKINLLIKFHHTEKIAKLENAQVLIKQLCDVQYPGIEHLTQLKTVEIEVGSIYREYLQYLTDSKEAKNKIIGTASIFSQKHLDNLFALDDESNFSYYFYMVTTSDEVLHLIPIIEFMINVKMNVKDNSRNNQIGELYNRIANISESDFFAKSAGKNLLAEYYDPFIAETQKILNITAFHQEDCERRKKIMENRKESINKNILENVETLNIKTKLVEQMTQPVDILYSINEDGKELVYIKQ